MKKIISFYFLFVLICMMGCSKLDEPNDLTEVHKSDIPTKSPGDSKYDLLGWGYDITGEYFKRSSGKDQIIDVEAVILNSQYNIVNELTNTTRDRLVYSSNASEYLKELNGKLSIGVTGKNDTSHHASVDIAFGNNKKNSTEFAMASYDLIILRKIVRLTQTPEFLRNFLTPKFKSDLATQSADYVIELYGTHVLKKVILGGRLNVAYSSIAKTKERTETVKAGLASVLKGVSLTANITYNTSLVEKNTNQECFVTTVGGNKAVREKITFGGNGIPGGITLNIGEWENSVSIDTEAIELIDGDGSCLIPIEELVSDPAKKAAIKSASEKYIRSKYVEYITPLHGFYNPIVRNHVYTADRYDFDYAANDFGYQGIICYVYNSQKPNTVPLHVFYNPTVHNHVYTADQNDFNYAANGFDYLGINCYVYKTQQPGTVPLHVFYNSTVRNHVYTADKNDFNYAANGFQYLGINCYVMPK